MVGPVDTSSILVLRQQILQRSAALQPARGPEPPAFQAAMSDALKSVSALQDKAAAASVAYERGDTQDLAAVMIARQKASIAFEATLQVRNRLLGAYKDVMNLPV